MQTLVPMLARMRFIPRAGAPALPDRTSKMHLSQSGSSLQNQPLQPVFLLFFYSGFIKTKAFSSKNQVWLFMFRSIILLDLVDDIRWI